jgi:hypothetical protein
MTPVLAFDIETVPDVEGIRRLHGLDDALTALDLSYEARPEIDIRLQQIVWLLAAGRPDEAQRYLDLARQHEYGFFSIKDLRASDLNILQQQIDRTRNKSD